jgi:ribonuclease T1
VSVSDLPPEARKTVDLIKAGGPFPYDRDGVVFQNRERILPGKQRGYYREYTVPTPGENDRGARRIITGQQGELYWTADHYDSFSVIVEDP